MHPSPHFFVIVVVVRTLEICSPVVTNPPCNAGDTGLFPGQGTKFPQATKQLNLYTTTTETRAAIRESMSHDERSSMPQLTQRSPIKKKNLTELYTQDLCISLNVNITINVCFLNNFFKKEIYPYQDEEPFVGGALV